MREQPTVPNRARPIRRGPLPTTRRAPQAPPTAPVPAPRAEQRTLRAPLSETAPSPGPDSPPGPARRPVRPMALPLLLPAVGGVWWAVGSASLDPGLGTLLLAAGLGAAVALGVALRRRFGRGTALPAGGRIRLVKVAAATAAGMLLGGAGLRLLGLAELAVPLACAITGIALFAAVRVVDERILIALAGMLLVLAGVAAVAALQTAGTFWSQGLVGMGAAVLCWVVAAARGGLSADLRSRP